MNFKKELNLSVEQSAKIDAIEKEKREAAKAIKSDTSLSEEQAKAKMMELRKTTQDKMKTVLTPEQQTKLEGMKKIKGPVGPKDPNAPKNDPK